MTLKSTGIGFGSDWDQVQTTDVEIQLSRF